MRYLSCYLAATDVIQTWFHQQETFIKQPCGFVPITCPFQWKSIQQGDNLSCNIFSKAVVKHTQAKNQHGTLCVASKAPRVRSLVAWEDALGFVYFNMYTHNHIHVFSTCLILPPQCCLFQHEQRCWCLHHIPGATVRVADVFIRLLVHLSKTILVPQTWNMWISEDISDTKKTNASSSVCFMLICSVGRWYDKMMWNVYVIMWDIKIGYYIYMRLTWYDMTWYERYINQRMTPLSY